MAAPGGLPPIVPPIVQPINGSFAHISQSVRNVHAAGPNGIGVGHQRGGLHDWSGRKANQCHLQRNTGTSSSLQLQKTYPLRTKMAFAVKQNDVTIITAPTGTGKSFILPLIAYMSIRQDPTKGGANEFAVLKVIVCEPTINQTRQLGLRLEENKWYGTRPIRIGMCHASHIMRSLPREALQAGIHLDLRQVLNNSVDEETHVAVLTAYLAERLAKYGLHLTHFFLDEAHALTFRTLTAKARFMQRKHNGEPIPKLILATATLSSELKALFMSYFTTYGLNIASINVQQNTPHTVHKRNWDTLRSQPIGSTEEEKEHGKECEEDEDELEADANDPDGLRGLQRALKAEANAIDRTAILGIRPGMSEKRKWGLRENLATERIAAMCNAAMQYYHRKGERAVTILVFCTGMMQQKSLKASLVKMDVMAAAHVIVYMNVGSLREDFTADKRGEPKIILATTNMQEGVTIADLKLVLDCGMMKALSGFHSDGYMELTVRYENQAMMKQRAGRLGRTEPGLYLMVLEATIFDTIWQTVTCHDTLEDTLSETDFADMHDVFPFLMIKPCQAQIDAMSKQFLAAGFGTDGNNSGQGFNAPPQFRLSPSNLRTPTELLKECISILHWLDPRDTIALLHSYQAGTFAIHAVFAVMEHIKWTLIKGVGADGAEGNKVERDSWKYFVNMALWNVAEIHPDHRLVSEKVLVARMIVRYLHDSFEYSTHYILRLDWVLPSLVDGSGHFRTTAEQRRACNF